MILNFGKTTTLRGAIALCLGGAAVLCDAAYAGDIPYALPNTLNIDKLGVDIASLQYERHDTFLSIGDPIDGGLSWTFIGHSGSDQNVGKIFYFVPPATAARQTEVKIGANRTIFVECDSGACQNMSGTAATLVKTGSNWFFTTGDGSIYKFDATGDFSDADNLQPTALLGKLLTITRPSGAVITINYSGNSIQSVVSSRGYALMYGANTISVVNLANHTCNATVTACDSVDASITMSSMDVVSGATGLTHHVEQITDPAGQNWQYDVSGIPVWFDPMVGPGWFILDGLYYFKSPTGYEVDLTYDLAGRLTTFTDNRGAFAYSYDESLYAAERGGGHGILTVTDPSGAVYFTASSEANHTYPPWGAYLQDPLGNRTQFGRELHQTWEGTGYVSYQRLHDITQPEGNVRTWTYNARGNIIQVTDTPKPGSGLTPISITATYPTTCTYSKSCNKPTSETDANGHTTNYTYSSIHGGLLSAMDPAPVANGARPLKLVTWVQKYPYYRNPSGALAASSTPIWVKSTETECQTLAGSNPAAVCDGSAPKRVTTYEYGANGTANNLWPHGIAVSSGGTTLRTCFTYDALGNKISETKPNANLAACP